MNHETWVLEWHQSSNNLHIQPLNHLLSKNREAYADNKQRPNWITIYVGTQDDCIKAADAIRPTLRLREKECNASLLECLES